MPELKVVYVGRIEIKYAIFPENRIVFNGGAPNLSSTTLAKEVIEAISKEERIDGRLFTWFDFQTNSVFAAVKPGEFDFRQLEISWWSRKGKESFVPRVDLWKWIICPWRILDVFSAFTGLKNPMQQKEESKIKPSPPRFRGISIRC